MPQEIPNILTRWPTVEEVRAAAKVVSEDMRVATDLRYAAKDVLLNLSDAPDDVDLFDTDFLVVLAAELLATTSKDDGQ